MNLMRLGKGEGLIKCRRKTQSVNEFEYLKYILGLNWEYSEHKRERLMRLFNILV